MNDSPDIGTLLSKFSAGTASSQEADTLFARLGEPGEYEQIVLLLTRQLEKFEPTSADDLEYWQERLAAIPGQITGASNSIPNSKRGLVKTLRSWRWAAAIIFAILTTTLVLITTRYPKKSRTTIAAVKEQVGDIRPGTNKAILRLANGSEILLDSVTSGPIAVEGSTIISRQSDGTVRYSVTGPSQSTALNTMTTPNGGQYQLSLPDGTLVWLNARSSISYPVAFIDKQRRVTVTGEVYFEVSKDPIKPFIVDMNGNAALRVLGTHFNINSYPNEGTIKVTLLEGKVQVSGKGIKQSKSLVPGEEASIASGTEIIVKAGIDLNKVVAWKNGLFDFNDADIKEVMRQLERWYDIEVLYEGKVPEIIFEGKMDRALSLSQVLRILTKSGVIFKIEGRKLIIRTK